MREFVGKVTLINTRRVYYEGDSFIVEAEDRRGQGHKIRVPQVAVEYLRDKLRAARRLTKRDAEKALAPVADTLGLHYTRGHHLGWSVQDVLIVLVALGDAEKTQEGRAFIYTNTSRNGS